MKILNKEIKKGSKFLVVILVIFLATLIGVKNRANLMNYQDELDTNKSGKDLVSQTKEFYVNDEANVLDYSLIKQIIDTNKKFSTTEEKPQVVVTTVSSLGDKSIEEYAYKLFEKYQIGNKDYDNGVLVLLAPNERDIRIEIGYGLEGVLTDSKSGAILDKAIPYLAQDNYTAATDMIFNNICNEIASEYKYDSSIFEVSNELYLIEESNGKTELTKEQKIAAVLFVICFIIVLIWDFFYNKGKIGGVVMDIFYLFASSLSSNSSSSSSRGSFGGGGRSGGGGSSRSF